MNKIFALEREVQQLYNQNQILRSKTKKIHQIEAYVNILITNNQSHQEEVNRLNFQNANLKNQTQILINQKNQIQSQYEQQFSKLKFTYDNDIQKLMNQIRSVANEKQKDQILYQQQREQLVLRAKSEIQRLKLEMEQMHRQYQISSKKMRNTINNQQQQLQFLQKQMGKIKKVHICDMNQEQNQKNCILNMKNNLANQNVILNQSINKKNKLIQQYAKIKQQLIAQLQVTQLKQNQQYATYQKEIRNLNHKFSQFSLNNQKLQALVETQQKDLQQMYEQTKLKNRQNQQLKSKNNKIQRNIKETQLQIKNIMIKSENLREDSNRIQKRYNQQILRLTQQNQLVSQKLRTQQLANKTKTIQIQDLINVIDKLQSNLCDFEIKIRKLLSENTELNKDLDRFTDLLQETNFQKQTSLKRQKQLEQIVRILQQEKNSLSKEMILLKQQVQRRSRQMHQIERQLNNENQLVAKKFKEQIALQGQKMLDQKRQLIQNHRLQKNEIIKQYQNALKQKDFQFKKRLNLLQEQIMVMRVRH